MSLARRDDAARLQPIKALALLIVLWIPSFLSAQNEIITVSDWRVHTGDKALWAEPGFDDSQWEKITYSQMNRGDLPGGSRWYRATFQAPADYQGHELAVGMGPFQEVFDVFVDGTLVGRHGSWQPTPHGPFPTHLAFAIPPGALKGPVGHIAIHQWKGASSVSWQTFASAGTMSFPHPPEIGPKAAIEAREQLHMAAGAIQQLPWDLADVLLLFAAAIGFVLFTVQRRRPEYLFLCIYCLLWSAPFLIAIPLVVSESVMARSWPMVLIFALPIFADAFALLFLVELCPRARRLLQFGALVLSCLAVVAAYALAEQSNSAATISMTGSSWCLASFVLVAIWALLLDRSFGSIAIATCLLLNTVGWFLPSKFSAVFVNPFLIDLRSVPSVILVFVTLVVLYVRFRNEQIRHAAIDQDLAAARRMQEQLLAGSTSDTRGFAVEAVYRPAREVGGDFYRTQPLEDGSLLVIVGDVSGKGLDAAMLVAVILGSMANETHRSPASLLEYLNRAVVGRTGGGFITACCARFYPDGRIALANAGQIAPYVDGGEVQLDSGLPLGISAEATYTETEITTDGTMTFVSDGVVEARDAKGELLGFERMGALMGNQAAEIAEAARTWGQEDDITVLRVTRTARLEAVPA